METTLVLLKPDSIQRRMIGRLLARFEAKGLQISAMKLMRIDAELAGRHYVEHLERDFYPTLEGYITSGPVVAAAISGPEAIQVVRSMVGPTNGLNAPAGTIRGDFSVSGQKNLVHASDVPESAVRELAIFFKPEELLTYDSPSSDWIL
jgi:nucleoside-diphosphate kinase